MLPERRGVGLNAQWESLARVSTRNRRLVSVSSGHALRWYLEVPMLYLVANTAKGRNGIYGYGDMDRRALLWWLQGRLRQAALY